MDTRLELVPVPVRDVDRAKAFFDPDGNGWTLQQMAWRTGASS